MKNPYYCYLNDIGIIAKKENSIPYIYIKGKGWIVDNDNVLEDRIMDYGTHSWADVDDITIEQANKFIELLEAGEKAKALEYLAGINQGRPIKK